MFSNRTLLASIASATLLAFFVVGSANGAFVQLAGTNWEYDTTPGVIFNLDGSTGATTGDPWLITESYIDPPNDNPIVTHWRQTTNPVAGGDNHFAISLYPASICE